MKLFLLMLAVLTDIAFVSTIKRNLERKITSIEEEAYDLLVIVVCVLIIGYICIVYIA